MSGVIVTNPKVQFLGANGAPLVGGTLTTYLAGTTTPTATYQDEALTAANTNPIVLDARGECLLWLDSTKNYKFVLANSSGVVQWTVDDISGADSGLRDALAAANGASLIGYTGPAPTSAVTTVDQLAATGTNKGADLVGFLQAGNLAVPTTVQAKLRETVSVFDFMTAAQIADVRAGVATNVATQLQNAINAASAAQVQLFWPKGTYYITSTLIVSSKVNWKGEGGTYSVIKQDGNLINMVNDDNSNMDDVIIDGLGFDFNGYNAANFATAMQFNALSHKRFRITNNRVFDSNYPGDGIVNQRQGLFIGQFNENIWVLNNDFSAGARIKVGRGGRNVFIQRNKLQYIDDNAITMAMIGTVAAPVGDFTENVHIEDNIIINPTGNGIFLGSDGSDKDDPAMYVKNVSVARNIIVLDTPYTDDGRAPRFIIFIAPAGGVSDVAINDNICVMTTNTPNVGPSEGIRIGATTNPVGTMDRLSICRNKIFSPYQRESAIQVGCAYATNDLVVADNEIQGYADCIFFPFAPEHNRPVITGNTIRGAQRGFRLGGNPTVVAGTYSRNRVLSPTAGANLFASTNAMEWRIESNEILDSAASAVEFNGAGTKNIYLINNDFRGAVSAPVVLSGGAAFSADSARYGNLGDTALITVASASTITIPNVQVVSISGTTNIDTITATGRAGQVVTLRFGGVLTVNDGTGNLLLAGNFTTSANDTLTLACTGTAWEEVARSVN